MMESAGTVDPGSSRLSGALRDESPLRLAADAPRKLQNAHRGTPHIEELVLAYEANATSPVNSPHEVLEKTFAATVPQRLVRRSRHIQEQLGLYSAQQFWLREAEDDQSHQLSHEIMRFIRSWNSLDLVPVRNNAGNMVNVTQKVTRLVDTIVLLQQRITNFNCLIYVDTGSLAYALKQLLQTALARTSIVIEAVPGGRSPKEPQSIADKFANGKINALIVPLRDEDMNLAPACLVVRFAVISSQLSYYWTRSSVRLGGTLVHLICAGSVSEAEALASYKVADAFLNRWAQSLRSLSATSTPPTALQEDHLKSHETNPGDVCIADSVTGGTISSSGAVRVVLCLASTLSPHTKSSVHELLTYMKQGSKYICTVHIPQLLPTDVSSSLCSTLTQARRDACFQACAKLQAEGLLAPRFFRPLPVDAAIGQNETEKKGTQGTPRRMTSFWQRCISATAGMLYPTLLRLDQQGSIDRTTVPTGSAVFILTRQPLPELNPFTVYNWGDSSRLETSRAVLNRGAPFEITSLQLELLYRYTLRVSRMITNKRFVCGMDQMAYLLAPMVGPPANNVILQSLAPLPVIHTAIVWDQVEMTSTTPVLPFVLEDLEYAPGYVVQERAHEFTKRFFVTHVRKDLSPLSKPEPGCREAGAASFLENAQMHSKRAEDITDQRQPLLEVEEVPTLLNALCPYKSTGPVSTNDSKKTKYVIPQLCSRLPIPAQTFRVLLLVPAVVHCIDLQLLSIELNATRFHHSIRNDLLLQALTSRAAHMDFDYERLEFLGDAFIKYFTSSYLFLAQNIGSLHDLHQTRTKIISNEGLRGQAYSLGLPSFMNVRAFSSKMWRPQNHDIVSDPPKSTAAAASVDELSSDLVRYAASPATTSSSKPVHGAELTQNIGNKAAADALEAVVGAAFVSGGQETAKEAIRAFKLPFPLLDRWEDMKHRKHTSFGRSQPPLPVGVSNEVNRILGSHFEHSIFVACALTYGSTDQLKFVGNAVFDFLVARHVFDAYPDYAPGPLTMLKSSVTTNGPLAALCVSLGLHRHLQAVPSQMRSAVMAYASQTESARQREVSLAEQERRRPRQYWTGFVAPQILADVLEAMTAVLFIHDGWKLGERVQRFFNTTLKPFFVAYISLATMEQHPTKVLCELVQGYGCHGLSFQKHASARNTITCNISVHGNALASAVAQSASVAARSASTIALEAAETIPQLVKNSCDCRTKKEDDKGQTKALRGMLQEFATNEADMTCMMPS